MIMSLVGMEEKPRVSNTRTLYFFGSLITPQEAEKNIFHSAAANEFQSNLINGLAKNGFESIISFSPIPFATFPKGKKIMFRKKEFVANDKVKIINIPFINVKIIKHMSILLSSIYAVNRERKKREPTTILSYNARLHYAPVALYLSKVAKIGYFVIAADYEHYRFINPFKHPLRYIEAIVTLSILKNSNGLICLSKLVPEEIGYSKAWIKMEGAISDEWNDFLPNTKKYKQKKKIIMYSGSLNESGGVGLLLDAFQQLEGDDYQLWISGRGHLESRVLEIEKEDRRVSYLGHMDREEYMNMLSKASILINPRLSRYPENRYNFPSKLLEYLASGTPVITTPTGDVEDDYRNIVFMLRSETSLCLAELIKEVLSMPSEKLRDFGAEAREFVLKNVTWESQAGRIFKFIEESSLNG